MLTNAERRKWKAAGQHLDPVAFLGKQGLTPAFRAGVDQALAKRELIKIKFATFADQRHELAAQIAAQTGSELVTVVGHVAVLYRPRPAAASAQT